MGKIVIPYKPRQEQEELHRNFKKKNVVVCHRRMGKTVFAINELIKQCCINKLKNPRYGYFAPTYSDAKDIAWQYLKDYTATIPGRIVNESELTVEFPHNKGRIKLYGCDTPTYAQKLRGRYFDGVVLDEYGILPPMLYTEVLRPSLMDRKGWIIFMGTPKGDNHFKEIYEFAKEDGNWYTKMFGASETNVFTEEQLAEELDYYKNQGKEDVYNQEYECSFNAFIHGAYFMKNVEQMTRENRICKIPYEPNLEVNTYWDLGLNDQNAIVFAQYIGKEIRIIDYYENTGEGLDFYFQILNQKGYKYGTHYFPHDVKVRMQGGTVASREDYLKENKVNYKVVPRTMSKNNDIDIARRLFNRMWIDDTKCRMLLKCLRHYHKDWDDTNKVFKNKPKHDWSSNGVDALLYLSVSYQEKIPEDKESDRVLMSRYAQLSTNQFTP